MGFTSQVAKPASLVMFSVGAILAHHMTLTSAHYCRSQGRYLSDAEFIAAALRQESDIGRLPLKDRESLHLQQPGCCRVNRRSDTGWFDHLIGHDYVFVELTYELGEERARLMNASKCKSQVSVSSCGIGLESHGYAVRDGGNQAIGPRSGPVDSKSSIAPKYRLVVDGWTARRGAGDRIDLPSVRVERAYA
jgi:hypothetical protein